jgi:hypothetical protein
MTTASVVHVTNLVTPGSEWRQPCLEGAGLRAPAAGLGARRPLPEVSLAVAAQADSI